MTSCITYCNCGLIPDPSGVAGVMGVMGGLGVAGAYRLPVEGAAIPALWAGDSRPRLPVLAVAWWAGDRRPPVVGRLLVRWLVCAGERRPRDVGPE